MTDSTLKRNVGFWGLLWASEGSIIGSGWLFGALVAATTAGPSALIGWVLASAIVIVLALVHAELAGMFPESGGTSRFPHHAFGNLAGMTFGWASYLQAAATAPIEVLAAIQYLSTTDWGHGLYRSSGTLSGTGILVAVVLMACFVVLNLIGIRWLTRANNTITAWKVAIPVLTIVVLLVTHFHASNFTAGGGFFVHGSAIHSILVSLPSGGIVFALLGFEQATQLGGEARNPGRDLPRAVILSILIGAGIYTLLQLAFIGSLDPKLLLTHDWTALGAGSADPAIVALNAGPFYAIASVAGLAWLAFLLRLDAVVSPFGSGLIYLTTSARISHALSRNGYIPEPFERTHRRTLVPVFGVLFSTAVGLLFLLPFPSWSKLVGIVTSASVLMYASAPLALGALRKSRPELPRVYRLPAARVLAPMAFVCATWIIYWSGWQTLTTLMVAMLVGYALIAASYAFKLNPAATPVEWRAAAWIAPYLLGMLVISYFGDFGPGGIIGGIGVFAHVLDHGGTGGLGLVGGLIASAGWSLVIYHLAVALRLPSPASTPATHRANAARTDSRRGYLAAGSST
ncbi:amino acid/polyamine/organocation transporter (APC superfamily) [Solirubrobacter pauli]|uniref:Amino acid/polyamine/organocation transporter (APC superfamily) n=1 Tax=Solirubrobacter pauli TaxID=166793 RepID=A0A660LD90_9ACTN|nr:APC family permease [Solirubrobacter pauli]RKQ93028.1 amino acid/polyamine/organocation transporter (APC superfamily) [Solirubrobacter pauli]